MEDAIQISAFVGTAKWAAPELFPDAHGPRLYTVHSDTFALALVVYECLWRKDLSDKVIPPRCYATLTVTVTLAVIVTLTLTLIP